MEAPVSMETVATAIGGNVSFSRTATSPLARCRAYYGI
jgi:hypothetical protein